MNNLMTILVSLLATLSMDPSQDMATYHPPQYINNELIKPYDWPISNPEDQGLDSAIFNYAVNVADKLPFIYSFLAVRNGYLISENYFNSREKNDAFYIASVSKSYLSALVGLALKKKLLSSPDQKMLDFFPEHVTPDTNPRKFDISIRHLMTMTAGYPYDSKDLHWEKMYAAKSMIKFAIDLPLGADPGQRWAYSTSSTHILSGIITKATGMSTYEFATKYLCEPLNIVIRYWERDQEGYYHGGWNMYFTSRDMARFGLLYLNNGEMDGVQIIPRHWIKKSLQAHSPTNFDWGPIKESQYGFLWWLGKILDYDVFYANGHAGQMILIIPEIDMVIVTTVDANCSFVDAGKRNIATIEFLTYFVLAPIRAVTGPPPYCPEGLSVQRVENHGLVYREILNVIDWQPNPNNSSVNISKYRVYRIKGVKRHLLAEIDANHPQFWHREVERTEQYTYAVTSVTDGGKESGMKFVSVQ